MEQSSRDRLCHSNSERWWDHQALTKAGKAMAKKLLPPVYPGEILREEFMVPMELSSNALARAIGVTPARVKDIVNEKRGITADVALRLGRYFGTTADVWINCRRRLSWKRRAAN